VSPLWSGRKSLRSKDNSREIINLYEKLHASSVKHHDLELRHVGRDPSDGRLKLIGFDSAMAVEDYKDLGYERMTLRSLLGVSPEWWDDAVKRARSSKREERIQTRIE